MIGQGTLTKISLFRQTTAFDSIVAKKDSLYFYNQDSVHRAYLPFAVDSIKQKGLDSLIIFQGKDFAIYPFAVLDNYFTEIQAGHGFSIPSWGVLPLFYNFTTSRYDLASIDSIGKACDILVVDLPDGNTIGIQNTGYIELNHALDVGY
ncbi:MAG: hypothetical protein ABF242_08040, partial [Flavobacteriales bacterium]